MSTAFALTGLIALMLFFAMALTIDVGQSVNKAESVLDLSGMEL